MATYVLAKARSIHYAWIVVAAVFVASLVAGGVRSSFGIYVKPFEDEFQATRSIVALVASISILSNGLIQPIIGRFLDSHGTRFVAVVTLLIAAIGLIISAYATGLWQLYITFGVIVSAAVGGPGTVMATVVSARWFAKHRGLAMGILSSAHSAGQLLLIPVVMQMTIVFGWRTSYVLFGLGIAAMVLPLGLLIRSDPSNIGKQPYGMSDTAAGTHAGQALDQATRTPFTHALRTHGFWMLAIGFFVCGYTSAGMISTHLVAFTLERGFDELTAAAVLGIMGAATIPGTILAGMITDRTSSKNPLAFVYFVRGLAILSLLLVDDAFKLYIFAVIFGLSTFSSVPPTSALTAQLFGRLSVGTIFGAIYISHQIGGAFGSYITGLIFDFTKNYYYGLLLGAILCFIAAAASYSIRERPIKKPSPAVAVR